jgi:hypothetical protein
MDTIQNAAMQNYLSQAGTLTPQGLFGDLIGRLAAPAGGAIGGLFGQQQVGQQLGGIAGQLGSLLPFGTDPAAAAYAQAQRTQAQLSPQGLLGGLLGGPLGGWIGSGIGSVLHNQNLGRQIGSTVGTIGGGLLPFGVDPVTAAYVAQQQAQLAPQGLIGNLLNQLLQQQTPGLNGPFANRNIPFGYGQAQF